LPAAAATDVATQITSICMPQQRIVRGPQAAQIGGYLHSELARFSH
jgi:hypothetical protein